MMYDTFTLSDHISDFDEYTEVAGLYNDIMDAIANIEDYGDYSDELDDILIDAYTNLSCFDLAFIGVTISVARNSGYYWTPTTNGGLGNEPECGWPSRRAWWKQLIFDDVVGATTAICAYGVGLAVPGANGAIAGAIAVHAAWHSAIGLYVHEFF